MPSAEVGAPGFDWMAARLTRLHALLRDNDYRGHDPFDLPNSPFFSLISEQWRLPQLLLSKFGSRIAPDRLRRLLRVPAIEDPKIYACCYFAYRFLNDPAARPGASEMIDRLVALGRRDRDGVYWGYDYTWATRYDGVNPRGASTLVPGSFAMLALLHDVVTESTSRRSTLADALRYYARRHAVSGSAGNYLGYFTTSTVNTHNANLLGCAALSLGARALDDDRLSRIAAEAASTSIAQVDAEGYLPYNDHAEGNWTDCFHHIYVIAAARLVRRANPLIDAGLFDSAIERMTGYLRRSFFVGEGRVNYFPGRVYPVDPHNYAAAALYTALLDDRPDAEAAAGLLLTTIDQQMWDDSSGRYLFRRKGNRTDRRFFLRWTQAWMFLALATVSRCDEARAQLAMYRPLLVA